MGHSHIETGSRFDMGHSRFETGPRFETGLSRYGTQQIYRSRSTFPFFFSVHGLWSRLEGAGRMKVYSILSLTSIFKFFFGGVCGSGSQQAAPHKYIHEYKRTHNVYTALAPLFLDRSPRLLWGGIVQRKDSTMVGRRRCEFAQINSGAKIPQIQCSTFKNKLHTFHQLAHGA